MYPETVVKQFGYDNETIFGFKTALNSTPIHYLPQRWHAIARTNPLLYSSTKTEEDTAKAHAAFDAWINDVDPIFVHMISKQFDLVFKDSTLSTK